MKILLVEPDFPYPNKSKNQANAVHKNFVPIGLLKLGAYYKDIGFKVKLVRGSQPRIRFNNYKPSLIFVTSLFTYWSRHVWESIAYYRELFPEAKMMVGGIYATLHHNEKPFKENLKKYNVKCHIGLHAEAEKYYPDYSLLKGEVDHHVTHAMRGCIRRCKFCGTWKIEPERYDKPVDELTEEIKQVGKNKVIFFDNNFFAHHAIEDLLKKIAVLEVSDKAVFFESQSGFDGRLLEKKPELAILLKKAHFKNIRIAWDNSLSDRESIQKQIGLLEKAGYKAKDISVFMIYNFNTPYETMIKKLWFCGKWGVQITDCRYRPLKAISDNYNPGKHKTGQSDNDYYIHKKAGWTDETIRAFRKQVRQHNIWIRYAKDKGLPYMKDMEKWSAIHNTFKFFRMGRPPKMEVMRDSSTWDCRLGMMNRVKNYCKKHNLNSWDFSDLTKKCIDEKLKEFLTGIEKDRG